MKTNIFTKENLAKYLGVPTSEIEATEIKDDGVTTFSIINNSFRIEAVELIPLVEKTRKSRIRNLVVETITDISAIVRNCSNQNRYKVTFNKGYFTCTCKDYKKINEESHRKNVKCKHIFKVLDYFDVERAEELVRQRQAYNFHLSTEEYMEIMRSTLSEDNGESLGFFEDHLYW